MPLSPTTLASELETVFAGVTTFADAGRAWASAYAVYAADATASGFPPTFTGLEQGVLATLLTTAFESGVASEGSTTLADMELAFQSYWIIPPVIFGAGVVSLAPPGLAALIASTFPLNLVAATSSTAAANIANAIHTWTLTVAVTLPGPTVVTLL